MASESDAVHKDFSSSLLRPSLRLLPLPRERSKFSENGFVFFSTKGPGVMRKRDIILIGHVINTEH